MSKIKGVVYYKLGRHKAYGMVDGDGYLYIDPRLKGKKLLEILIHEATHELLPKLKEEEVLVIGKALSNVLWKEGFRRVDNSSSRKCLDTKTLL